MHLLKSQPFLLATLLNLTRAFVMDYTFPCYLFAQISSCWWKRKKGKVSLTSTFWVKVGSSLVLLDNWEYTRVVGSCFKLKRFDLGKSLCWTSRHLNVLVPVIFEFKRRTWELKLIWAPINMKLTIICKATGFHFPKNSQMGEPSGKTKEYQQVHTRIIQRSPSINLNNILLLYQVRVKPNRSEMILPGTTAAFETRFKNR